MNQLQAEILEFKKRENFPVASIFLPEKARRPILAFYNFARATDEIADSTRLTKEQKLQHLNAIYSALQTQTPNADYQYLAALFAHTKNGDISIKNCLALIEAFIQDANGHDYKNFDDLLQYCRKSAGSVGRIVLEACEEYEADFEASDKICAVLQILNHLQDLKSDYINLNRLYFAKSNFYVDENAEIPDLKLSQESLKISEFKTEILNEVEKLLNAAKHLPRTISSLRVRIEIQTIINICYSLHEKLLCNNIMQNRIELTKAEKICAVIKSLPKAILQAPKFKNITQKTKSSFFAPLLKLPQQKQQAMFAFYAFCHEVDDIIDEKTDAKTAEQQLNFWLQQLEAIYSPNSLDYPTSPIAKKLIKPITKYNLKKEYFVEIINGQFLDLQNKMIAPSDELFEDYCYKVASCVGLVAVDVFGYAPENKNKIENFAINLGKALQIINIMRDVREDAAKGRIYLPASLLQNTKLANITPEDLYKNYQNYTTDLQNIFSKLAEKVELYFVKSDENLPTQELSNMKVALLIRKVYEGYFNKMKKQNFIFEKPQIKLSKIEKLKILIS